MVQDVEFPPDFSVDVPNLRDVEFVNVKLWLTIDGGWFGRAQMRGCRFIDSHLDALRVRKADLTSNHFERVQFGGDAMGGFHAARVDDMMLIDCRVRDHSFMQSTLTRLQIRGGSMADLNIMGCELTSSRLSTDMDEMNIIDCAFVATDASTSVVGEVAVLNWRSADLRLPRARSGFFYSSSTARSALGSVLPELSAAVRERVITHVLSEDMHGLISDRFLLKTLHATSLESDQIVDALLRVAPRSLREVPATKVAVT